GLDQPELAVSRRRGVKVLQRGGHITSLRIHETEIRLGIAGGELQAMLDAEPSRLEEVSLRRSERSPADMDETAVRESPGSPLGVTCAAQRRQSPTELAERVVVLAQLLEDRGALDVG